MATYLISLLPVFSEIVVHAEIAVHVPLFLVQTEGYMCSVSTKMRSVD